MDWGPQNTWIVVVGVLSAVACALLGNYLVLRRMSMMGDAISHAVLPGIAVAFLLSGSRDSLPMFIGAAAVGVLTALLTQWVHSFGKVEESASMGVVFTTLFAIGLILIERGAREVDLDPGCVLYGAIDLTPMDTVRVLAWDVPRAALTIGGMLLVNLLFILAFYKELKITSFDPALATTLGINATLMHYLLMALVAATTVACFESVGSILVIAMLIVPGATAHLLTDRLWLMLLVSAAIAVASAAGGHVAAITVPDWFGYRDTETAGSMAAVAGLIFLLAVLAAPRYGLVSRLAHQLALRLRILREDVLGLLYRHEELAGQGRRVLPVDELARMLLVQSLAARLAIWGLRRRGKLVPAPGGVALTEPGRQEARQLVRSHRLWETFLYEYLGLPKDHVHVPADRLEHVRGLANQMDAALGHPAHDPHGQRVVRSDRNNAEG
jgi:manganese/zinc/iron transport system permease protein